MKKLIITVFSILLAAALLPVNESTSHWGLVPALYAQDGPYPYAAFNDRKEGILKKRELVAGEKLVLVAAAITNNEAPPAGNPPYHLGFYLPGPAKVKVQIWEFDKQYKMEPLQKQWQSGPNRFAWSPEIPRYYNIAVKDLLPMARMTESPGQEIVPVVLYYRRPEGAVVGYHFYVVALDEIITLTYKIYNLQTEPPALVYAAVLQNLPAHQHLKVQWHGKDQNNTVAASGKYSLFLEARFKRGMVAAEYPFYHQARLLQEKTFTE